MTVQEIIEKKLADNFNPLHLDVINESNNHNVPEGSESHFKVVVVSPAFAGKNLLSRHRLINTTLADELKNSIHALAIHAYTEDEWNETSGGAPMSPPCLGGGK
ncbi:MAG: BolA/IbaG family iron-sulfur metabolism protein [Gammaproteobacteria bacterium]|nr:BolA/IbaG family iron-sulfur metabolism protein [Gammaproteobacteria bacterium]MCW8987988.1 BolA/IbaG family iron-sulfur metabolism protein [Gammaproteobacteria bacterium]MCW9030868.1 BolA/IbaG family iron-sulfur metabolism protein [Gammaproteobacteria bacterium]